MLLVLLIVQVVPVLLSFVSRGYSISSLLSPGCLDCPVSSGLPDSPVLHNPTYSSATYVSEDCLGSFGYYSVTYFQRSFDYPGFTSCPALVVPLSLMII